MTRATRRSPRSSRRHRRGSLQSKLVASHWMIERRRLGHPERGGWRDPLPGRAGSRGAPPRRALPPRRWGRARSRAV